MASFSSPPDCFRSTSIEGPIPHASANFKSRGGDVTPGIPAITGSRFPAARMPALPLHVGAAGERELGDDAKLERQRPRQLVLARERVGRLLGGDVGAALGVSGDARPA